MKRVYVSHPIRGKGGADASPSLKAENCRKAIEAVNVLRAMTPHIQFYVPAEHEDFIGLAYELGQLSEEQILNIDCHLIDKFDAVIVLNFGYLSRGMEIEIEYCKKTHKPCFKIDADSVLDVEGELIVGKAKKTSKNKQS